MKFLSRISEVYSQINHLHVCLNLTDFFSHLASLDHIQIPCRNFNLISCISVIYKMSLCLNMAGHFNFSIIMSYFAFKMFPFHLERTPFHRISLVISYMIFLKILSWNYSEFTMPGSFLTYLYVVYMYLEHDSIIPL